MAKIPVSSTSPYRSCIHVNGRPILPPVLTSDSRTEMQHYRELAIITEKRLRNKERQKQLSHMLSPQLMSRRDSLNKSNVTNNIAETILNISDTLNRCVKIQSDEEIVACAEGIVNECWRASLTPGPPGFSTGAAVWENKKSPQSLNDKGACNSNQPIDSNENEILQRSGNRESSQSGINSLFTNLTNSSVTTDGACNSYITDKLQERLINDRTKSNVGLVSNAHSFLYSDRLQNWSNYLGPADEMVEKPNAIILHGRGACNQFPTSAEVDNLSTNSNIKNGLPLSDNSPCKSAILTDASTPASLASTDLGKYVDFSPETDREATASSSTLMAIPDLIIDNVSRAGNDSDNRRNVDSSCSSSTAKTTSAACSVMEFQTEGKVNVACDDNNLIPERDCLYHSDSYLHLPHVEPDEKKLVRQSSYTILTPSPALIAHALKCEGEGLSVPDMSSVRKSSYGSNSNYLRCADKRSMQLESDQRFTSNLLLQNCHLESENSPKFPESRLEQGQSVEDLNSVNQNKQNHLENYLKQLSHAQTPNLVEPLSTKPTPKRNSAVHRPSQIHDYQEIDFDISPPPSLKQMPFEEILLKQSSYFEQIRLTLVDQHSRQMQELLDQQQIEQSHLTKQELAIQHALDDIPQKDTNVQHKGYSHTAPVNSLKIDECRSQANCGSNRNTHAADSNRRKKMADSFSTPTQQTAPTIIILPDKAMDPCMKPKFDRISAVVKGCLVRRLLATEHVQNIIKTIRDTLEFALNFHAETPVKAGKITRGEASLHKCILTQLTEACYDFHDVFFKLSTSKRMQIISIDRALQQQKATKNLIPEMLPTRNLTAATLKVIERKKLKGQAEVASRQISVRPKSSMSSNPKRRKVSKDSSAGSNYRPKTSSPRMRSEFGHSAGSVTPFGTQKMTKSVRRNLRDDYRKDSRSAFSLGSYRLDAPKLGESRYGH